MIGVVLALAMQGAPAADVPLDDPVVRPQWLRRPSAADLARHFPRSAQADNLIGQASVRCIVDGAGRLANCSVMSENPGGAQFGEATVALSRLFQMSGKDADGASTEGRAVRVPVFWRLPVSATTKPVVLTDATHAGTRAEVDCRLQGGKFDNCLAFRLAPWNAEFAKQLATIAENVPPGRGLRGTTRVIIPFEVRASK